MVTKLATPHGPRGYLFQQEGNFDPKGIVRGPWDAYPMTFAVARLLWWQRDNIVRRLRETPLSPRLPSGLQISSLPEAGMIVSDPRASTKVLLMLSAHPYHWHLEDEYHPAVFALPPTVLSMPEWDHRDFKATMGARDGGPGQSRCADVLTSAIIPFHKRDRRKFE